MKTPSKEVKLNTNQKQAVGLDEITMVPIFKTGTNEEDYNRFLLVESNRTIRPNKIANLRVEIERNDLTHENEIKVVLNDNNKLIILEGQHRFIT